MWTASVAVITCSGPGPAGTWQEEAAQHNIAKRRNRKETERKQITRYDPDYPVKAPD